MPYNSKNIILLCETEKKFFPYKKNEPPFAAVHLYHSSGSVVHQSLLPKMRSR